MLSKNKKSANINYYDLIPSQDAMYLMFKFGLHKQMSQIPTSVSVDYELDFDLLQKAFDIEIQRNDALRIRFVKKNRAVKQYFIDPYKFKVPVKYFSSVQEQEKFFSDDAKKPVYFLKDELFRIYFFKTEGGGNGIYANFTHLITDALGIVGFYFDLLRVYVTLLKGQELPKELDSYEEHIQEELEIMADKAKMEKHEKFYKEYFLEHGEPFYAGVHGPALLEAYRKKKKNPDIRVPMAYNPLHDKCDMIVEHICPEDAKKIFDYCLENRISPESIFVLGLRTYCSAINYRIDDVSMMTVCSRRSTLKEKNMCGCLAQPLIFRSKLAEELTFDEALKSLVKTRVSLYRHLNFPYTKARDLSLSLFNYGPIQGANTMMYSWIPIPVDDRFPFKLEFKTYNLERYFTPLYTMTIPDPIDKGINMYYMYRVKLSTQENIKSLHKNALEVILKGIENPDITLKELLDGVKK